MLYIIKGRSGSGKTEYILKCLKERQSAGMDCLFLAPEQQSLQAETLLEDVGAAQLDTEVLNFERLPDRVFREIGGVATERVDGAGRCVLIAAAVNALRDRLKLYSALSRGVLSELAATIAALKRLGISAERLSNICAEAENKVDAGLADKLKEIAMIYSEYQRLLGNTLEDDDDPLERLAGSPAAADFFKGKAVFVDGIYTFTPQQDKVMELIVQNAAEVFISFTVGGEGDTMFDGSAACIKRIEGFAGKDCLHITLDEAHRSAKADLRYGESALWSAGKPYAGKPESVFFTSCETVREEALYAASVVYELRSRGYAFGDIAIACREPEAYAGVLDRVFASYDIPCYFAAKDNAATKPLSAAVLALLEMAEKRLPLYAVKKYLISTFSVLDTEQADVLIRYAESWDIKGKAWISENDWLMNPEGYSAFTPETEKKLSDINNSRRLLADSLSPVINALKSPKLTVGEGVKLLYDHICECRAEQKLAEMAETLAAMGDDDGAEKTAALWGAMVDIFDRLYTLCADMPVSCGELRAMIEAMLEGTSLGAIPSYSDAVSVGSARLMRATGVKAMLLLGVNDGVFPSLPEKAGVFTARESAVLEGFHIDLLPSVDKAIDEERFYFYSCASAPSDRLYFSYVYGDGGKPSVLYNGVRALFPEASERVYGADERDYMFCRKAALDRLPYIKNAALKQALKAELTSDAATAALLGEFPPVRDGEAYIRESTLELMTLSYSRIDCYNNCGMSYLMRYVLKLKDDRHLSFRAVDSGKYMHYIMEKYVKGHVLNNSYIPADKDEIKAEIDAITDEYLASVMRSRPSKRLQKLIDRLKNAAAFVCDDLNDEFAHSSFVPFGFEVRIGKGGVTPPLLVTEGGRRVTTVGSIDRIDGAVINGRRYVRVVDYKSSKHTFKLRDVEKGEKMQMLSYLFAYCDAAEDGALPAGALYRAFTLPDNGKPVPQTGFVLDDEAVRNAMDSGGNHIGTKEKADKEAVKLLKEQVYNHIRETADLIGGGKMCAETFKKEEQCCDFCPYGEVCRQAKPKKTY